MPYAPKRAEIQNPGPSKRRATVYARNENGLSSRKRHIVIIGAGVSGVLLAHHFRKYLPEMYSFEILEKNTDVGGTWLENTYPGCACDVPSDIYQFSFAPKKDWSATFSPSTEIQHYLHQIATHFNLLPYIKFSTRVTHCQWSEQSHRWNIKIISSESNSATPKNIQADILINASGILNNFKYPDIPGLETFSGTTLHTAAWDHSIELSGKKVGVIGAGASAVQVVPQIQPIVDKLAVYIRTPSWITAKLDEPIISSDDVEYKGDEYLQRCKYFEDYYNKLFPVFFRDSTTHLNKTTEYKSWMIEHIHDPGLRKQLIPEYELGCRRISPGEPFLNAIQKPNVTCFFDPIECCEPAGLKTRNGVEDIDVLIAATGFDTTFRPRFPLIGRNGVNMQELWKEDPAGYMGIGCAGFPNYLCMLGPNCPVANGSLIGSLEATADFIVRLLKRVDGLGVASFAPDEGAQREFNQHIDEFMEGMVWTGNCSSWYKQGKNGKVTAVWPGSSLHYREVLEQNRWEDWQWTYAHKNRYKVWSDGKSEVEKQGGDHSYYLKHGPMLPSKL